VFFAAPEIVMKFLQNFNSKLKIPLSDEAIGNIGKKEINDE